MEAGKTLDSATTKEALKKKGLGASKITSAAPKTDKLDQKKG